MVKRVKPKPLTIVQQKVGITQKYTSLVESMSDKRDEVDCILRLQPSAESRVYRVRIRYRIRKEPKVWLLEPPLTRHDGKLPPHIYAKDEDGLNPLCVFYPPEDKWTSQKSLAYVFVPWISTWLYAYEIWQITGVWTYPEKKHDNHPGE